jgi:A/G-specific adenine glycosylase
VGRVSRHNTLVDALLEWGAPNLRDLPWRRTRDPWNILVSEVMLQQTSVDRVLPKYEAFLQRFPQPCALAESPLGDALQLWSGLGYPRRCRNLHAAATCIVNDHDGCVPSELDALLALPGIGPYTARAVQCFAFEEVVAVVDVNVSRVLSRIDGAPMAARPLQHLADSLVPHDSAWVWNQVMMDFGAQQCTARTPQCSTCPVRTLCRWKGKGVDPALGSAGVSRPQMRFSGSDRQARGRAIKAVIDGTSSPLAIIDAMQLSDDTERAERLLKDLVTEGLLVRRGGRINLP